MWRLFLFSFFTASGQPQGSNKWTESTSTIVIHEPSINGHWKLVSFRSFIVVNSDNTMENLSAHSSRDLINTFNAENFFILRFFATFWFRKWYVLIPSGTLKKKSFTVTQEKSIIAKSRRDGDSCRVKSRDETETIRAAEMFLTVRKSSWKMQLSGKFSSGKTSL